MVSLGTKKSKNYPATERSLLLFERKRISGRRLGFLKISEGFSLVVCLELYEIVEQVSFCLGFLSFC